MKQARVFLDSDVVISSLISSTGAASALLTFKGLNLYSSNLSQKEVKQVTKRLKLDESEVKILLEKLKTTTITEIPSKIKRGLR